MDATPYIGRQAMVAAPYTHTLSHTHVRRAIEAAPRRCAWGADAEAQILKSITYGEFP
jgi:hypothetical protein